MSLRNICRYVAYRFAKGYPVVHPYNRAEIQVGTPLDFLVVSEHAEYMGVIPLVLNGDPVLADSEAAQRGKAAADAGNPQAFFAELVATGNSGVPIAEFQADEVRFSMWEQIVDIAEQHNEPGTFTTFAARRLNDNRPYAIPPIQSAERKARHSSCTEPMR